MPITSMDLRGCSKLTGKDKAKEMFPEGNVYV